MLEEVQGFARQYVTRLLQESRDIGSHARFMHIGLPKVPALVASEMYNVFHGDEELRQAFAQEVIRLLGIEYHIALKCPRDPSNPPFSDVVATYIADRISLHDDGRIVPMAVMAREPKA